MVGRRKYDNDGCAVAHGLDLVGERWALLVVRELLLGPKRFTDLRTGLPGASPDMITARLRELTEAGVVRRRRLAAPAASWVYELTEWGAELEPVVLSLARWSSRSPGMHTNSPIGVDSVVLSLRALFDARSTQGLKATLALRLNDNSFGLTIADDAMDVARAEPEHPDATLTTDSNTFAALLAGRFTLAEAQADGRLEFVGDRDLTERVLRLFPLPEPVSR